MKHKTIKIPGSSNYDQKFDCLYNSKPLHTMLASFETVQIQAVTSCSTHKIDQQETDG